MRLCRLHDCERRVYSRGLCWHDWRYWRKHRTVRVPGPPIASLKRLPVLRHP